MGGERERVRVCVGLRSEGRTRGEGESVVELRSGGKEEGLKSCDGLSVEMAERSTCVCVCVCEGDERWRWCWLVEGEKEREKANFLHLSAIFELYNLHSKSRD